MAPPSDLVRAIRSGKWSLAAKYANSLPEQASQWSKREALFDGKTSARVLPLHEALVAQAPLYVIKALVNAYSHALYLPESSYQRLPLHCACRKANNVAIIDLLVRRGGRACLVADSLQRLPLHYALTNGANPDVVKCLMKAQPKAARGVDHRGWTPVHIAMNVGASHEICELLLEHNPESVWMRTERGSSLRACIPQGLEHADALRALANAANDTVKAQQSLPSMRQKSLRVERYVLA